MNIPYSLYFHLPFCRRKCPYCHFFVLPESEKGKELLQTALLGHLQLLKPQLEKKHLTSVYFGGGTPTLFGPERIEALLATLSPPKEIEITIEANPEEVSLELMSAYKAAGINRVSIGLQTLDDELLKTLGRTHTADKALQAVLTTQAAGLTNISVDLMYELPGQTVASFEKTLKTLNQLPISHLSLYNLTFEPNTPFYKKRNVLSETLPTSEESLTMLELAVHHLEQMGLLRYEISAFAKSGYTSIHNTGYWTARPFYGLGPSAFSYTEGKRYRNHSHLGRYAQAVLEKITLTDFEEQLIYPNNLKELLAVELRLLQGVNLEIFEARHGLLPKETLDSIQALIEDKLLLREKTQIKLSPQGLLFYDSVASCLL